MCAVRPCGPLADAVSLSSRQKGSVKGNVNVGRLLCVRKETRSKRNVHRLLLPKWVIRERAREKTHDKVDVFDVGVPLELERELVEVPHAHLRLVCPRSDDVVAIASRLYAVARLRKLEMLYELDGALHALANRAFSLRLRRTFPYEPVR